MGPNEIHQRILTLFETGKFLMNLRQWMMWLDLEAVETDDRCAGVERYKPWRSAGKLLGWSEGCVLDTAEQRLLIDHPWAT